MICAGDFRYEPAMIYAARMTSNLGNKIRAIRQELKLKQDEFADQLGTTQGTVSRWERGSKPEHEHLQAIAAIGKMTVDQLLAEESPSPHPRCCWRRLSQQARPYSPVRTGDLPTGRSRRAKAGTEESRRSARHRRVQPARHPDRLPDRRTLRTDRAAYASRHHDNRHLPGARQLRSLHSCSVRRRSARAARAAEVCRSGTGVVSG